MAICCRLSLPIWLTLLHILLANAIVSTGREGSGIVGYGIRMARPACAYACRDAITNPLKCKSGASGGSGTSVLTQTTDAPPPECYANNEPYLQTLAYCISQHCSDVPVWRLERYWEENVAGREAHQPRPRQSYQATLALIGTAPRSTTPSQKILTTVSLVDNSTYFGLYNAESGFTESEIAHERYGLVLIFTTVLIPIAWSLLRFVPFRRNLISRLDALLIYPSAIGRGYKPLFGIVAIPSRRTALFLVCLWIINIILCAVSFHSKQPNSWYATKSVEIATYVANRFGVLSFANLAISILFAGRNNVLLWITSWSYATFLQIHRWVAFISVLQACLHSAIYLWLYTSNADYSYSDESKIPYWYWGIVATLSMALLIPVSLVCLREKLYELFLTWHIVLSVLALVGCYFHIYLRFEHQWGYEVWIYIAFAFWAFDRLLRLIRMAKNGVRTAKVTVIDEDYIRLDIFGVFASGQAYLYFPNLTWRVWENHPFSVAAGLLVQDTDRRLVLDTDRLSREPEEEITKSYSSASEAEKAAEPAAKYKRFKPPSNVEVRKALGLTFFIRARTGVTSLLRMQTTLPVLLESSYGHSIYNRHGNGCLASYPNLICVVGGVGITAIIPILTGHFGHKKLYWGVRQPALVQAIKQALGEDVFAGAECEIVMGRRLNLDSILRKEISLESYTGSGTAIVVSGPRSMADEARTKVASLASNDKSAVIGFFEESYGW